MTDAKTEAVKALVRKIRHEGFVQGILPMIPPHAIPWLEEALNTLWSQAYDEGYDYGFDVGTADE